MTNHRVSYGSFAADKAELLESIIKADALVDAQEGPLLGSYRRLSVECV